MQSLVEDLLLLARADERGLTVRHDDVDLDDLAAGEAERLRRETGLEVHTDFTPTRLVGDAGALSRVLRNLLDNAAMYARSRIDVTVSPHGDTAQLRIGDDGPGIPENDRQRVFDRFVRLHPDRSRSAGGSGLGLAIVSEIVAAHRGSVRIDDRAGGGTLVTVQLPVAYSPDSSR
jgi:signal transduction histidine kinase